MSEPPAGVTKPGGWRGLLDHPRGLWVLAHTELWDRISFHGMQALLVLYMTGQLLLPGHVEGIVGFATFRGAIEAVTGPLTVTALATQTFGLYTGLIYFTPVLGGIVGDRFLGRQQVGLQVALEHLVVQVEVQGVSHLRCL